jgi:lysophospholipase L1-like esterase
MKSIIKLLCLAIAFCSAVLSVHPALAEPALTLKADDLWVMAGDSITAQRLHTNYIEAFFRTRYPQLNLHFRNSGIGGNRTGNILQRFDYDVAAWKPTIVSIELGMNDVNAGDDPAGYIKGMHALLDRIREIKATPVFISSSPINDGSLPGNWTTDRCRRIDIYTNALQKLAEEQGVVFLDQYHPLLELWGKNMPAGSVVSTTTQSAIPATQPGKLVLRSTGRIELHGDAVHTGSVGQYTMAATILTALHVDREVSSATLKADGTVVEAKGCSITDSAANDGHLSFTRLDERGPWPIDPRAKAAVELLPEITDLSRYLLTVQGLPTGKYAVTINGKPAATLSADELAAGWNMSTLFDGALAERSTKIIDLLANLQGKLNTDWRAASKAKSSDKLAAAEAAIEAGEREVSTACKPVPLHFEIKPD